MNLITKHVQGTVGMFKGPISQLLFNGSRTVTQKITDYHCFERTDLECYAEHENSLINISEEELSNKNDQF